MQNHSLSAHPTNFYDNFKHLSPQASNMLVNLQKLREKEATKKDGNKIVTRDSLEQTKYSQPPHRTQSIVQVSHHPVQNENEMIQSLNYSFIQTPNPNKQHVNSIKLDDPTPDFKDQQSSDRNRYYEAAMKQLYSNKQQVPKTTNFNSCQNLLHNTLISQSCKNKSNNNVLKNNKKILNSMISFNKHNEQAKIPESCKNMRKSQNCSMTSANSSQRRCNSSLQQDSMYQKALLHQEKLNTLIQQGRRASEMKEIKECTFVPKINQSRLYNSSNFFSRLDDWMRKKNDKIFEQKQKVKDQVIKECTFSPNQKQISQTTINQSDVYERNRLWKNQVDVKKQRLRTRNSMAELNYKELHAQHKKSIKRSNSSLTSNFDLTQAIKLKLKSQQQQKEGKASPVHSCTETTTTPNSIKQCLKSKRSIEDIDQKYKMLCEFVDKVITNPTSKKN